MLSTKWMPNRGKRSKRSNDVRAIERLVLYRPLGVIYEILERTLGSPTYNQIVLDSVGVEEDATERQKRRSLCKAVLAQIVMDNQAVQQLQQAFHEHDTNGGNEIQYQ